MNASILVLDHDSLSVIFHFARFDFRSLTLVCKEWHESIEKPHVWTALAKELCGKTWDQFEQAFLSHPNMARHYYQMIENQRKCKFCSVICNPVKHVQLDKPRMFYCCSEHVSWMKSQEWCFARDFPAFWKNVLDLPEVVSIVEASNRTLVRFNVTSVEKAIRNRFGSVKNLMKHKLSKVRTKLQAEYEREVRTAKFDRAVYKRKLTSGANIKQALEGYLKKKKTLDETLETILA